MHGNKIKSLLFLSTVLMIISSACGPTTKTGTPTPPPPTLTPTTAPTYTPFPTYTPAPTRTRCQQKLLHQLPQALQIYHQRMQDHPSLIFARLVMPANSSPVLMLLGILR